MFEHTVEITKYCPYGDCDYCSSNASRNGKHLTKEEILKNINAVERPIDILIISGGEPLFHPNIGEIIWFCRSKAEKVKVYTNMIECLVYNSDKIKDIEVEANVCMVSGRERYLPKPIIGVKTHLLKLVHQGRARKLSKQIVSVSTNFHEGKTCEECDHTVLQANGKIVSAPCKKEYEK